MTDAQPKPSTPEPRKRVRGSRILKPYTLDHGTHKEVREHVGFNNRVLSDLPMADLRELVATHITAGIDGVMSKYGLTRGEWLALAADPSWQATMLQAATATRTAAITRFMLTLPRLAEALEAKARDPQTGVDALIDITHTVTELLVKIGGIEQKLAVTHSVQSSQEMQDTLDGAELGKLQRLNRELSALSCAGVELSEVVEAERGPLRKAG